MKILNKKYISFLLILFSNLALSEDVAFLGLDDIAPAPLKKTLRNTIVSSVSNEKTESELPPVITRGDNDLPSAAIDVQEVFDHKEDVNTPLQQDQNSASADELEGQKETVDTLDKKDQDIDSSEVNEIKDEEEKSFVATEKQEKEEIATVKPKIEVPDIETVLVQEEKEKRDKKEKGVLYQPHTLIDDHETVHFNFEETDLAQIASYMERVHNIKFISDDIITTGKEVKGLSGHKVSFRTNKVFSKKQSWDLFLAFLHIAGFDVVPLVQAGFYKIVLFSKVNAEAIPSYIGVDYSVLPDNDMVVRYVYFVKNIDPAKIQNILSKMQSGSAKLDVFSDLKALIFTDRACNIKSLMNIATELDRSVMPQALSVIKLKKTNVDDVIALYQSLKPAGASGATPQKVWMPNKKEPSLEYFPQDVITIGDKRTNSLILLGDAKSIKKIEDFIEQYIDINPSKNTAPVFTYQLQYTNATDIQPVISKIVQYGASTPAGQTSGVRNGIKYFGKMTIVAEPHSNSLIINSTQEDYEQLKPLIDELDIPQKQIGLEVLIVQVRDAENKILGSQISGPNGPNAVPGVGSQKGQAFLKGLSGQTSGIPALSASAAAGVQGSSSAPSSNIVVTSTTSSTNPNLSDFSIKSSLASLLCNPVVNEAGSVLVTFGEPIWALFKILKSISSVHLLANPFLVVSNNSTAQLAVGEERRIVSAEIYGTNRAQGFTKEQATLGLKITPQINKENIINLTINVENSQFLDPGSTAPNSALADRKTISTYASVANGEVLVLGGLMTETYSSTKHSVPFLEHIPIFGWFFKSKIKTLTRDHFLVFIAPKLIESPYKKMPMDDYTYYKMGEAQKSIELIESADWFVKNDPIENTFFGPNTPKTLTKLIGQNKQDHQLVKKPARIVPDTKKVTSPKKQNSFKTKKRSDKVNQKIKKGSIPSFEDEFNAGSDNNYAKKSISNSILQPGIGDGHA